MKSRARLTFTFEDADTAKAIASAVSLDDQGYITTKRHGRRISAEASADGPMSLLHTLDDYLACVSVAERTTREARLPARVQRPRA